MPSTSLYPGSVCLEVGAWARWVNWLVTLSLLLERLGATQASAESNPLHSQDPPSPIPDPSKAGRAQSIQLWRDSGGDIMAGRNRCHSISQPQLTGEDEHKTPQPRDSCAPTSRTGLGPVGSSKTEVRALTLTSEAMTPPRRNYFIALSLFVLNAKTLFEFIRASRHIYCSNRLPFLSGRKKKIK